MLEALSLDQLRVFIAAAETGSFSAAGRKLRRAQSLVSQTVANLEGQLDVQLFDRPRNIRSSPAPDRRCWSRRKP